MRSRPSSATGATSMDYVVRVREPRPGEAHHAQSYVTTDRDGGRYDSPQRAEVIFKKVQMSGVDFSGVDFKGGFSSWGATFSACDFRRTRLSDQWGSSFGISRDLSFYRDCRFDGADLRHSDPGRARFERCTFDGARIEEWDAERADFVDCRFSTRLLRCAFYGQSRVHREDPVRYRMTEFRGNDFRQAELIDTAFRAAVDISAQLWPDDPRYLRLDRLDERIPKVRAEVSGWPLGEARREALGMLKVYSGDVFNWDQREDIYYRDDLDSVPKEIRDRVWSMLEHAL